jgi:hypothetical protein
LRLARAAVVIVGLLPVAASATYVNVSDCTEGARRELAVGQDNGVAVTVSGGPSVAIVFTSVGPKGDELALDWRYRGTPKGRIETGGSRIYFVDDKRSTVGGAARPILLIGDLILIWSRAGRGSAPALLYCPASASAELFRKSRFEEMP